MELLRFEPSEGIPNNPDLQVVVYHDAQERNRGYMVRLAVDRLLYTFRANAGLPVGSAKPLGGWEQPENGQRSSELRGHFPGHFLSASAQLAANGDTEAKAKADYMVAELAKCQAKLGGKYLSAFPTTWWDRLEKGEGSAGKLFKDPSLYNNLDQGLVEMRELVKAIRENPKKYLTIHFRIF